MRIKDYIRPGKSAADITPLFLDNAAFSEVVNKLAQLFNSIEINKVVCVEGRGFILGGALAYKLGVGFIPIRAKGKLQNETYSSDFIDYSKTSKSLEIHQDAVVRGDKILLIDDWVETGNTIKAAIELIKKCGGEIVGVGTLIDDSSEELKEYLKEYNYQYLEKVSPEDTF